MNRTFRDKLSPRFKSARIEEVHAGPIRHDTLPDSLVARIKQVAETLAEVDDTPLEQIIEDFQKDAHPEREIQIWETIAYAYRKEVARNPSLTLEQKKEVFAGLLQASMVVHPISATPQNQES